jgi:hypothetical protein
VRLKTWHFFLLLFGVLLGAHLCHQGILWEPETLPMAAAKQMLLGKVLYRDIWYDKPPLVPVFYVIAGGYVRVAGAVYSLLGCMAAYAFARDLYGRVAGVWAAGLLAFFLIFDFPVSVIPVGPDMLMLLPHLLAVYLAWQGRLVLSGVVAGMAFLCNTKAVFVLAACGLFGATVLGGFVLPVLMAADVLFARGAWRAYLDQVWVWSSAYAGSTFVEHPVRNGIARTAAWMGFHSGLAGRWSADWRLWAWLGLSFAGVALGWRFFPRYYLQVLPPAVILASGGLVRAGRWKYIALLLLVVPLVRFGPRYVDLALRGDAEWSDSAMDRDSREASAIVKSMARAGDTMFIWGYRPEDWVYTSLPAASRYLDCQALTGVPADRHLTQSTPVTSMGTAEARKEVAASKPEFVLDGLTPFNTALAMDKYPELAGWMTGYEQVARTKFTVIYRKRAR